MSLLATLAINWEPQLRGYTVVLISIVVLIGGTYLVVGTNLGARLGFLVILGGLFGWLAAMGAIWWTYGIGLKGREPSWRAAEPATIIRDGELLQSIGLLEQPLKLVETPTMNAASVATALVSEGWTKLDESDPQRGQAVAASDEILINQAEEFAAGEFVSVAVFDRGGDRWPKINDALDFVAFFHEPRFALVEVAPVVPQRIEPGRAPARPKIDETQERRYVHIVRDLGNKRQPAMFITIGSLLVFVILCWLLHRRDLILRENLARARELEKV
ncbi:MAG: hypothetical protein RL072_1142 [Actinomycetota bacterium]|jgi:hypothetical protein